MGQIDNKYSVRQWLGAFCQQAITWTSIDVFYVLSSMMQHYVNRSQWVKVHNKKNHQNSAFHWTGGSSSSIIVESLFSNHVQSKITKYKLT